MGRGLEKPSLRKRPTTSGFNGARSEDRDERMGRSRPRSAAWRFNGARSEDRDERPEQVAAALGKAHELQRGPVQRQGLTSDVLALLIAQQLLQRGPVRRPG